MIVTDTHVFFYGQCIYSNWHCTPNQFVDPTPDDPDGIWFDSAEQGFMHYKARFFDDMETAVAIVMERDPRRVKELGRNVRKYNDKAWECVRLGFMTYVCYLKFSQNPEWARQLKDTGNRTLVEASPYDRVWGIGRSVEEAAAGAPWNGRNLLGEALMTVRGLI